jgi:hypothetical protein
MDDEQIIREAGFGFGHNCFVAKGNVTPDKDRPELSGHSA